MKVDPGSSVEKNAPLAIPVVLAIALVVLPFVTRDAASFLLTMIFVLLVILLGLVDYLTLRIPNVIVFSGILFMLVGTTLVDITLLPDAAIGAGAILAITFALALVARGSMGMGDVKFSCLVGASLGLIFGILALAVGFVVGAIGALILVLLGRRGRGDMLPLTPSLAVGAILITLMFGTVVT